MPVEIPGVPFAERGGQLRGVIDLASGRYPRFVFGGAVGAVLPVFHFHEATPEALEPAFAYLTGNGYRAVGVAELAALVRQGRRPGDRTVLLAFDDALASMWTVAGPLLRRYGLRAVTYAIPGRVRDAAAVRPTLDEGGGADAARVDASDDRFATWPELRALAAGGHVDVQSHTHSHAMIFTGAAVVDFVQPAYAVQSLFHRPRLTGVREPGYLAPSALGHPLFARRSRMADGRRFLPDEAACAEVAAFVAAEGGAAFFTRPDWRAVLEARAAGISGRWESDAERAQEIEDELAISRDVLAARLGIPVAHACLPWGVSGALATRALERLGYLTAFANRWRGRMAVSAGDAPFFLKRLHSRYVFSLPGRGRRTWLFSGR